MDNTGIFDKLEDFGDWLGKITLFVVIILTGILVITVLTGVFFRYIIRDSLSWTEELARYLMIWAALLAVSVGIKDKEHVGIQLLIKQFPPRITKLITFIVYIITIVFLGVLTFKGYQVADRAKSQLSLALNISMYWPLMSIPVSGALAIIQQLIQLILIFKPGIEISDILGATEVDEALREVKEVQIETEKGQE
ncbi:MULTISPECIES: TRAP transporter small permease [Halanaerobium]|uniref:TRAP-type C4-dicarboxylate transport system permease small subunit n=1 Tax=Halanaerobium saccharolyticum TaxID=43595 RepID=A0A4R6SIJ8_9FIRM|nr:MULTISPECIES: TRAP transporter small permease [Halanaerobium]PUU91749.1 MAG: tripartite AtP-independent periplasmic transporter subunit DctQ [Halanaerobium sp.]TDQ01654.1 TRAP-type C4-dicarboxylate transport system permease small subunit [Halanaerobium saccharolyticum]